MIDPEEIEREIIRLESRDTSYAACERLAVLYVVRDHLMSVDPGKTLKAVTEDTAQGVAGSDFLIAASSVPVQDLLRILDDHMQALRVVFPREYDAVMLRMASAKK